MRKIRRVILFLCVLSVAGVSVFFSCGSAADVDFEISIDRNSLPLGSVAQLKLTFNDTQSMPAPQLPRNDGFESRYRGPSTMMSIVNGQMTKSVTHIYSIIPLRVGNYTLGPFTFSHRRNTYRSNSITIHITDGNASPQRPTGQGGVTTARGSAQNALEDYMFMTMEPTKTKGYLNENIPVTIKLYVSQLRVSDIEYPKFSHDGFSAGDFEKPRQYQQLLNGVYYEVVEFNTVIFGTRAGVFSLGPAQLECNVLMKDRSQRRSSGFGGFFGDDIFDDFFGRYERHAVTIAAPAVTLTVLPLPEDNKPANFDGTLGAYSFTVEASPQTVTVGDPITLKMTISGTGNFSTVSVPSLENEEGFKVYAPQIQQKDDAKYFEQIILPTTDAVTEIPKLRFSFFDTEKGAYRTITRGPFPITVHKGTGGETLRIIDMPESAAKPLAKEVLGRDIVYIKEYPGRLRQKGYRGHLSKLYWASFGMPVIVYILFAVLMRRQTRLRTDVRYARKMHAPKKARKGIAHAAECLRHKDVGTFYDAVFKTLQEYLGNIFHVPAGGITVDVIDSLRGKHSIDEEIIVTMRTIFEECDMARYAPSSIDSAKMQETFRALKTVIDEIERCVR